MVRQPPKLLSRVIRAITILNEQRGSTVPSIVSEVRNALDNCQEVPRNVAMLVRSALNHAIANGLVVHRAGKYRLVGRRRVLPVDSLEMAVDCKRKRRSTVKKGKKKRRYSKHCSSESDIEVYGSKSVSRRRTRPRRKKSTRSTRTRRSETVSTVDSKRRGSKSQSRRRGRPRRRKSTRSTKTARSETVSNAGSNKNADKHNQKPATSNKPRSRQATPSKSATENLNTVRESKSESGASSPDRNNDNEANEQEQRRGTPYPESASEAAVSSAGSSKRRKSRGRGGPRRQAPLPPPNRNQQPDGPPAVEDEPMDESPDALQTDSTGRQSLPPRQRDGVNENDSLDDIHDRPPSYYN